MDAFFCICETCNSPLLYIGIAYAESGVFPLLTWPRHDEFRGEIPKSIEAIYREASIVKRNAPNAFAILIRKALEAICDDRNAGGSNLALRLKDLSNEGEIPPVLSDATDVLRIVGNSAAHGPLLNITTPMIWAIDDLFRTIVEYVYIAPAKLAKFRSKVNALKNSS